MKQLYFRIGLLFVVASTLSMIIESGWDAMYGTWFIVSVTLLFIESMSWLIEINDYKGCENPGCISRTLLIKSN